MTKKSKTTVTYYRVSNTQAAQESIEKQRQAVCELESQLMVQKLLQKRWPIHKAKSNRQAK